MPSSYSRNRKPTSRISEFLHLHQKRKVLKAPDDNSSVTSSGTKSNKLKKLSKKKRDKHGTKKGRNKKRRPTFLRRLFRMKPRSPSVSSASSTNSMSSPTVRANGNLSSPPPVTPGGSLPEEIGTQSTDWDGLDTSFCSTDDTGASSPSSYKVFPAGIIFSHNIKGVLYFEFWRQPLTRSTVSHDGNY